MPKLDLKRFNEAIVSYSMHSPFVKQMLNLSSVCKIIIPKDWLEMFNGVLGPISRIATSILFREEATIIEQCSKSRSMVIS